MKNTGLVKRSQAFGTGDGTSQLGAWSVKEGIRCSKVGMELGNAVPPVQNARHRLTVAGLRKIGQKMVGQCPACAEVGGDKQRNHLVIQADGRFGCVIHPGISGKEHRQRIFQLIGDRNGKGRQHLPATPLDISLL